MEFPDLLNLGVSRAEFQLRLMEAALRALSLGATLAICGSSLTYFLLWLAELRRARRSTAR